ncbi:MAG: CHAD domain-containing protein [Campylobacterales bacterium]|nr:CHAD domain-containing protein [Campylobacterales bacterium]
MKSRIFDPLDEIKKLLEHTSKELDKPSISNDKQIHSIRVMSKQLRSLLYLIKPFFNDKEFLKSQNQFYKELAKSLSQEREAKVMYDTFQWLIKKSRLPKDNFEDIQTALQENLENKTASDADIDQKLQVCKQSVMMALDTINEQKKAKYTIKDLKTGFFKTYKKAYDTLHLALATKEIEDIHLFRKYAKYHMYQIQLLSNLLRRSKQRAKDLDKLTSLLGRSHDLALFAEYLYINKNLANSDRLISCISKEQKKLTKEALKIAKKTFKHRPKKLKIFNNIDN